MLRRAFPTISTILAVCAGQFERNLFEKLNFTNCTVTNISTGHDAHDLPFEDQEFDVGFVHAGLHHCRRPHQALTELYRVSSRTIVIESRDSSVMRIATTLSLSESYEVSACAANDWKSGGVDNTPVPNYVYRWTEREIEKVVRSYDPTGDPAFRFFYDYRAPANGGTLIRAIAAPIRFLPRQSNVFGVVIDRPTETFEWIR